jgi:hypothetical protein
MIAKDDALGAETLGQWDLEWKSLDLRGDGTNHAKTGQSVIAVI